MTVTMAPSKFDICLISGFIFNFACVTANYWPSVPPNRSLPPASYSPNGGYGQNNGNGYYGSSNTSPLVSSGLLRVQQGYNGQMVRGYTGPGGYNNVPAASSPSYPPNYSYSPLQSHFNYPNSAGVLPMSSYPSNNALPPPLPPMAPSSSLHGSPIQPTSAASMSSYSQRYSPYYKPNAYTMHSSLPLSYWRNPASSGSPMLPNHHPQALNDNPYETFDRRTGPYVDHPPPYGAPMYPSSIYDPPFYPRGAAAKLKSKASKVEGEVRFYQQDTRYIGISGRIIGLTPGAHGLHVHESREKDSEEFTCDLTAIGNHFNPSNSNHGGKSEWIRHVGDLGNIFADADGIAEFSFPDSLISLTGPHSILNRTLVVTEFGDDLGKGIGKETIINGNSGKPIACGVIHPATQLL